MARTQRLDSSVSTVAVAFVLSRAVSIATVVVARCLKVRRFTFEGLVLMDGGWYRFIAQFWYGPQPAAMGQQTTWPFFPLLPAVGRVGIWLHVDSRVMMVVVSNGAFLIALVGVHRLVAVGYGAPVANYAVWVTAIFPASFVFSMAYPDALFLAGSVWAFVMLREARYGSAGAFAAVAVMARPNGIFLVVALAVGVFTERTSIGPSLRSVVSVSERSTTGRPTFHRMGMTIGPALIAMIAWCGWLWNRAGDPFIFYRAKSAWHEVTIVEALAHLRAHALPHLACVAAAIIAVVVERRRLPLAWQILAALWLLPSLVLGTIGLGRYTNECFPAMIAVALLLSRFSRRWATACLTISGGGLVLFSVLVGRLGYVP